MLASVEVFQSVLNRLRGVVEGCCCSGKGCREEVPSLRPLGCLVYAVHNASQKPRQTNDR